MIHICKKRNCPRRFSIGSETDSDYITYFCTECREIYYYSKRRTKSVLLILRLLLLFFIISVLGYYLWSYLNKPTVDSIVNYGLNSDSLTINTAIFPKLIDESAEPFKLDFGQGNIYDYVPDSITYDKPGVYDIIFESDYILDKRKIIIYDPSKTRKGETKAKAEKQHQPNYVEQTEPVSLKVPLGKSDKEAGVADQIPIPSTIKNTSEETSGCLNEGKPCDDNNDNTEGDIIRSNCKCEGITIVQTYYKDQDGDGLGDSDNSSKFKKGKAPSGIWVDNSIDKCPLRMGLNSPNGCPVPKFSLPRIEKYHGETFVVTPIIETILNDKFSWLSDEKIKVLSNNTKAGQFQTVDYGLSVITFTISNPNGFNESASIEILSKISQKDLEDKIRENLIVIGQFDPGNNIPKKLRNKSEKTRSLLVSLFDRNVKITEKGRAFGNNIGAFIDAKMLTKGSYVNDVRVNKITYNNEGLIDNLDLELIKFQ